MIDLGEKKRPDYDMRVYDHEDLVLAGAGDVRFLMDRGAVRLIPEGPGFSVGKPLSGQQKRVLKNWIEDHIIDRNNPHKEISVSRSIQREERLLRARRSLRRSLRSLPPRMQTFSRNRTIILVRG